MNEVVKLVREQFPGDKRADGILTLELGRWAQQNKPEWFEQFPEFARQYKDIERTLRPGLGTEFADAFGSAVDNLQATTLGAGAMAADLLGANRVKAYLAEQAQEQMDEAAQYTPSVGSYKDVDSLADAAYYVAFGLGTAAPSMLESAALAGAGAAIGTAASPGGGTLAGGLAGLVAKQATRNLIRAGVKDLTSEVGKAALKKETKALAARYLGQTGMLAASIPQAQGEIYNEIQDEEGGAGIAATLGTLSGLLDIIPESYVFSRFFKPGAKVAQAEGNRVKAYLKQLGAEAAKTMPMEGTTESAQEFINFAAEKWARGEPPTITDGDVERFINAGLIGMMAGGAMAPVSALGNGRQMTAGEVQPDTAADMGVAPPIAPPAPAVQEVAPEAPQETEFDHIARVRSAVEAAAAADAEAQQQALFERGFAREQEQVAQRQAEAAEQAALRERAAAMMGNIPDAAIAAQTARRASGQEAIRRRAMGMMGQPFEDEFTVAQRMMVPPPSAEPSVQTAAAPASLPQVATSDVLPPAPATQVATQDELPTSPVANLATDLNGLRQIIDFRGRPLNNEARLDVVRRISGRGRASDGGVLILDRATGKVHLRPTRYNKDGIYADYVRKNKGRGVQVDLDAATGAAKLSEVFKVIMPDGTERYELIGATNFRTPQVATSMVLGDIEAFAASPEVGVLAQKGESVRIRGDARSGGNEVSFDAMATTAAANQDAGNVGDRTVSLADIPTDDTEGDTDGGQAEPTAPTADMLPRGAAEIILEAAQMVAEGTDDARIKGVVEELLARRNITRQSIGKTLAATGLKWESLIEYMMRAAELASEDIMRTVRAPGGFRMNDTERAALFTRLVSAIRDSGGEVAAFEQGLLAELGGWQETAGFQLSQADGRSLIGLSLDAVQRRDADAVVALTHEVAHYFLEKLLPDPALAARFQVTLDRLPWANQRWLLNPLSTDLRLLANAERESLTPAQRAMVDALPSDQLNRLRQTSPDVLLVEQAAEHLAMLGLEKANARSLLQQVIRAVKDILLRTGMAIQRALKGTEAVGDRLVRSYVENRWLQFINRDFARSPEALGSLRNHIGAPKTYRERITAYRNVGGGDPRVGQIDIRTGQWYPTEFAPETVTEMADRALDIIRSNEIAQRDGVALTVRSRLRQGVVSHTPVIQFNREFAAINYLDEVVGGIWSRLRNVAPAEILERESEAPGDGRAKFLHDYAGVTRSSNPTDLRESLKEILTGSNVEGVNPATRISDLKPLVEESTDLDGDIIKAEYASAQQYALDMAISRLQVMRNRATNRLAKYTKELERLKKRKNPSDETLARIRELDRDAALISRVLNEDGIGLLWRLRDLEFRRGVVTPDTIYPGAVLSLPTEDNQSPGEFGSYTVPKTLHFTEQAKLRFIRQLAVARRWLDNLDNIKHGAEYNRVLHAWTRLNEHFTTELVYTPVTATLRKSATKSIVDILRQIGVPGATHLARQLNEVQATVTRHAENARIMGVRWSDAYVQFAKATGNRVSQTFQEVVWDELSRTFEQINEGTTGAVELGRRLLKENHGIEIESPAARAAFTNLVRVSRESQLWRRQIFKNLGLKVEDPGLGGAMRDLRDIGYFNGQRSVSRVLESLYAQMAPNWSYTGDGDHPLLQAASTGSDEVMALFFDTRTLDDFVEPLIEGDAEFIVYRDEDGPLGRARQEDVRAAWAKSGRNVLRFADELHRLRMGNTADEVGVGQTRADVMAAFLDLFNQVKREMEQREKVEGSGVETMPRQMMDARQSENWPARWVSYGLYDTTHNYTFLMQAALNSVLGPNGFGAGSEFDGTMRAVKRDIADAARELENNIREGMSLDDARKRMGKARYTIARQADDHMHMLRNLDVMMRGITRTSGYQLGDMRKVAELLNLQAALMLQQPKSFLVNFTDLMAGFYTTKFSRVTLDSTRKVLHSAFSGLSNSVGNLLGLELGLNSELTMRRERSGIKDPGKYVTWKQKMADARVRFPEPDMPEGPVGRAGRALSVGIRGAREVINLGREDFAPNSAPKAIGRKFRPFGIFSLGSEVITDALVDGLYHSINDLALRGVEFVDRNGGEAFVKRLESGTARLDHEAMGYVRKWLILNDKAAFDWLSDALVTKMRERSIEDFVAKAWRRKQQAQGQAWEAIDNDQFSRIVNVATNELSLQANFVSTPLALMNNPAMRVFSTFLIWPWNAMQRGFKSFRTPQNEITMESMIDGLTLVLMGAIPTALAASLAVDFYDEKIVGKKSNLRDISATGIVPGVGLLTNEPMAILERLARYGTFGLLSEAVNGVLNFEDARGGFTADSRIFIFSQLNNLRNLFGNLYQQEGEATYQTVGRPLLQFIGMNGVLQYTQIASNLLDVDNAERQVNERINSSNYLRAAGRALDLDVRIFRGQGSIPTPITPYIRQMELAAISGNDALFREAYAKAIQMSAREGKEDPVKAVRESFGSRHPLRRIFRTLPSETEYRAILSSLDQTGRDAVARSVTSYNRYLEKLGSRPVMGRSETKSPAVMSVAGRPAMTIEQARALAAQAAWEAGL